jgi:outer membrane protein OmpA-like peptidoglycan-associated protein
MCVAVCASNEEVVMSISIADAIHGRLTEDAVAKLAGSTGESAGKTRSAMTAGVFATVAGLIRRGTSREGAAGLLSSLRSGAPATNLLGDEGGELTDIVATSSGTSLGTASGAMGIIAPIAAGVMGNEIASQHLDASGISSMLLTQKQELLGNPRLPSRLANILQRPEIGNIADPRFDPIRHAASVIDAPHGMRERAPRGSTHKASTVGLIAALVIGPLILAGLLFLTCGHAAKLSAPTPSNVEAPIVRAPTLETPGTTTTTGAKLEGKKAADKAAAGNQGLGYQLTPGQSFVLPNTNFEFATTKMSSGAGAAVNGLAEQLEAHPDVRIRLTGYTDSSGSPAVNNPLSWSRANATKKMLVDKGIDAKRIEVIGRGAKNPVSGNDTKNGRLSNRRVEVTVLPK